jgi:alkylation response protein AidB-like acyl-CoA dehydrogenase
LEASSLLGGRSERGVGACACRRLVRAISDAERDRGVEKPPNRSKPPGGRPSTLPGRPLVRENLALIKAEEQAALASTLALTALVERLDRGQTDEQTTGLHRFLVNANKYVTSLTATLVIRRAIETLGGNGTIEDFSPLPRLYRDAIVLESWEGAHNVLVEQVRRDAARFELVPLVLADLRGRLAPLRPSEQTAAVEAALAELEPRLEHGLAEPLPC